MPRGPVRNFVRIGVAKDAAFSLSLDYLSLRRTP